MSRRVRNGRSVVVVVAVAWFSAFPSLVQAQVFKYVDDRGATHYVGSADQVPEAHRAKVEKAALPEAARQPDHSESVAALAEATFRRHRTPGPTAPRGPDPVQAEWNRANRRLQVAYRAREAHKAVALAREKARRAAEAARKPVQVTQAVPWDAEVEAACSFAIPVVVGRRGTDIPARRGPTGPHRGPVVVGPRGTDIEAAQADAAAAQRCALARWRAREKADSARAEVGAAEAARAAAAAKKVAAEKVAAETEKRAADAEVLRVFGPTPNPQSR